MSPGSIRISSTLGFSVNEVAAVAGMAPTEVNHLIDYSRRLPTDAPTPDLLWGRLAVEIKAPGRRRRLAGPASVYAAVIESSLRGSIEASLRRRISDFFCAEFARESSKMLSVALERTAPADTKRIGAWVKSMPADQDIFLSIASTAASEVVSATTSWAVVRDLYEATIENWSPPIFRLESAAASIDLAKLVEGVPDKVRTIFGTRDEVAWSEAMGTDVLRGTKIPVGDVSATLASENGNAKAVLRHYPALTEHKVKVADLYHRAHPRRGRPRGIKEAFPGAVLAAT